MAAETVTLQLPESLYLRLAHTAQATGRSLDEVILHTLNVGSPPTWDDAPPEFQATLAALDRFDDDTLWQIARSTQASTDMTRYDELLERQQAAALTADERLELAALRAEADRFMLRKAHAVVLLRWRGVAG
jgi:hypothetical protein